MQEVIRVERLTKSYGRLLAANNISFSVMPGMVFGLLGANGAGKSTVIECVLGTKRMDGGRVSIAHRKKLFEKVGVQFQESNYQDQITVGELCKVTASLYQRPADPNELLKRFGIAGKQKNLVRELSGGQRQRLFIVLALIPDPKVVFLDELTTGLDAKARREVWLTIFLTSHFMDEVEALCDQVCILKKGEIVFYGTVPQAIKGSPCSKFEDAYLWYTSEEEQADENV
mgnify:CR=1 FL=1